MLGKLLKEEIKSYILPEIVLILTVVLITIYLKVLNLLPYKNDDIRDFIAGFSSISVYYMLMISLFVVTILMVIRFYSTTASDQAYLTWTLPVKTGEVIWAKLLGGYLWRIVGYILAFMLGVFFFTGFDDNGPISAIMTPNVYRELFNGFIEWFEPKYLITMFLYVLVGLVGSTLPIMVIYFCIAVGQLFGKWRILASIGCYFLIIFITQVLYIVFWIGFVIGAPAYADKLDDLMDFDNINAFMTFNVIGLLLLIGGCGLFAILFALINHIFKNHLNLE